MRALRNSIVRFGSLNVFDAKTYMREYMRRTYPAHRAERIANVHHWMAKPENRKKHVATVRRRRERLMALGLCIDCGKRKGDPQRCRECRK